MMQKRLLFQLRYGMIGVVLVLSFMLISGAPWIFSTGSSVFLSYPPIWSQDVVIIPMNVTNHTSDVDFGQHCSSNEFVKRFPTAILIGERKTGTSAILEFLGLINPYIRAAPDEPHFFDDKTNVNLTKDDFNRYLNKMLPSCPGDVVIEKTPRYFRTYVARERISRWNKDIKLLLSLRDPVQRLISDYHFEIRAVLRQDYWARGYERLLNLTFKELVIGSDGKPNVSSYEPVRTSLYDINMAAWLQYFPLKQFHFIDSDAFTHQNPAKELRKIEEFLGVPPRATEDLFLYNDTKGFYCLKKIGCMEEEKGHNHSRISPAIIHTLTEFYTPHMIKLHDLIGQKLSWMDKYLKHR